MTSKGWKRVAGTVVRMKEKNASFGNTLFNVRSEAVKIDSLIFGFPRNTFSLIFKKKI